MLNRAKEAKRRLKLFEARARPRPISDIEFLEANGCGMDAYDEGMSIHDNPHSHPELRAAWHQGWRSAEHHRDNLDSEIGLRTMP